MKHIQPSPAAPMMIRKVLDSQMLCWIILVVTFFFIKILLGYILFSLEFGSNLTYLTFNLKSALSLLPVSVTMVRKMRQGYPMLNVYPLSMSEFRYLLLLQLTDAINLPLIFDIDSIVTDSLSFSSTSAGNIIQ